MAPGFQPDINNFVNREYTLSEACDLLKSLDGYEIKNQIRWVDSKTKKPVYIGYSDSPKRKYEMVKSKSNFIPQTNNSPKQKSFLK